METRPVWKSFRYCSATPGIRGALQRGTPGAGSPDEAARLLWEAARDREPWAVQALQKRLAPEAKQINVTHGLPAQQNQPAEQQETREAETSLKLYYYPARWERWTK